MSQKIFKVVSFALLIFLFEFSLAADDELTLDDELPETTQISPPKSDLDDSFAPAPPTNSEVPAPQKGNEEISANANLASPLEVLQNQNALYGFSMGLVYAMQPISTNYDIVSKFLTSGMKSVKNQYDAIQSVGVILRYAVVPFLGLGTDINVSYFFSQNHATLDLSPTSTLKGELNFTYGVSLIKALPIYFLFGFGAERVNGSEVNKIIQNMGYGGQAGAGIAVGSTINIEGIFSYYQHRLSNNLVEQDIYANGGPEKASIDTEEGKASVQGLTVRGSYSFK